MGDKINFGLDPAVYLAFTAQLCSGSTNSAELVEHADSLLAAIANNDLTVIARNAASLVLAQQLIAQSFLQRAIQADTAHEAKEWLALSRNVQMSSEQYSKQPSPPVPPKIVNKTYWEMTPAEQLEADANHRRELIEKGLVKAPKQINNSGKLIDN